MTKKAYDVIIVGAGANSKLICVASSWSENANPSGSNEKAGSAQLSRVDQGEVRDR